MCVYIHRASTYRGLLLWSNGNSEMCALSFNVWYTWYSKPASTAWHNRLKITHNWHCIYGVLHFLRCMFRQFCAHCRVILMWTTLETHFFFCSCYCSVVIHPFAGLALFPFSYCFLYVCVCVIWMLYSPTLGSQNLPYAHPTTSFHSYANPSSNPTTCEKRCSPQPTQSSAFTHSYLQWKQHSHPVQPRKTPLCSHPNTFFFSIPFFRVQKTETISTNRNQSHLEVKRRFHLNKKTIHRTYTP